MNILIKLPILYSKLLQQSRIRQLCGTRQYEYELISFSSSPRMFSRINFFEIFPSKWSSVVFITYIGLFISQGLLVTASQKSSVYEYSTVMAVLLTELLKLVISILVYCSRNSFISLYEQSIAHYKLLWLYFIPSFLYCMYNNLSYVNLLNYDPATYFILLQLRVVITGVLFQVLFSKMLTCTQWFSLILLTIGCMVKNFNFELVRLGVDSSNESIHDSASIKMDGMGINYSTMLIIVQVMCSCFAGVYCEYLLKNQGLRVDIFIQNLFMYFDSIICNAIFLHMQPDTTLFSSGLFDRLMQPMVLLVILNGALAGIVTSFFLKHLNSILKTIAAAIELIFIAILSWIFFSVPIKVNTSISIFLIAIAIMLYSRNPVHNPPKTSTPLKDSAEDV